MFFCGVSYHFSPLIFSFGPACVFLDELANGLPILFIFSKKQLLVSLIFSILFRLYFTLTFIVFCLLLALGSVLLFLVPLGVG